MYEVQKMNLDYKNQSSPKKGHGILDNLIVVEKH